MSHILVFPYPAQGHMLPLLDLTHHLSLQGLTITILVTPKNLPILQPLLSTNPSIQTLILPFPSHPCLPPGVENIKDIGNHGNPFIISALTQLSLPITTWFKSHPSPPRAILSDFFLGWTQELATQLGVPRISFYSSGAFLVSVLTYLLRNSDEVRQSEDVCFRDLPNSPLLPWAHLPSLFRRSTESSQLVKNDMTANISSWGAVFNTLHPVESPYLEHIRKELGHRRVWAVGPIALLNSDRNRGGLHSTSTTAVESLSWLDGCDAGSVVYVCFGSQVFLTRGQMEALAKALEESGTRFVLAVKAETFIPDGFEDRVGERGVVIKGWAPQVSILSHRAVGGFLTHCGWNSVLEGIVAGVMLFAWPMEADQFVNAKLLVDDLGVAVRVCEGVDTVPDAAELGKVLSESMSVGVPEKVRARELQEEAVSAVREGGSSKKELDELVEHLHSLAPETGTK